MFQEHFTKACKIQADQQILSLRQLKDTTALTYRPHTLPDDMAGMSEAVALASSVLQQSWDMQRGWAQDWQNWVVFSAKLTGADTMSKFVARQNNIVLQAQAQISSQINDVMELMERTQVGYSYWLSQLVAARRKSQDHATPV